MDSPTTVLVVDDDEADRTYLSSVLEGAGYRVHQSASGHAAAVAYARHPIDIVLTDIVMPDGDGVDLLFGLRQIRPNLPVIAVSGKGLAGLSAARAMGATQVFAKPVDAEELLEAVRSASCGKADA